MVFANDSLRSKIGLRAKPLFDPDVRARRLVIADPDLARVLYSKAGKPRDKPRKTSPLTDKFTISAKRSAWDIARERYNDASTKYVFPDGSTRAGNKITKWKSIPPGTLVVIGDASRSKASKYS